MAPSGGLEAEAALELSATPRCVALDPSGQRVVVGFEEGALACWELTDPAGLFGEERWRLSFSQRILAGSFLTEGFVAAASGSELWAVDVRSGARRLLGQRGTALCLAPHPSGALLASGAADGRATLWEIDWRFAGEDGTAAEGAPTLPRSAAAPPEAQSPPAEKAEAWLDGGVFPWGRGVIANRFVALVALTAGNVAAAGWPTPRVFLAAALTPCALAALAALRLLFLNASRGAVLVILVLITGVGAWGCWRTQALETTGWPHRHLILVCAAALLFFARGIWGEQSAIERIIAAGRARGWSVADMFRCAEQLSVDEIHRHDKGVILEVYGEAAEAALSSPLSKAGVKAMRRYGLMLQDRGTAESYETGSDWLERAREREDLLDFAELQEVQSGAIAEVLAGIADPKERARVRKALEDPEVERLSLGFLFGLQEDERRAP